MYSPALGRFLSADTVVPGVGNPQTLNRYSFVLVNPIKYTDPTGHKPLSDGPITCGEVQPSCQLSDAGASVGDNSGMLDTSTAASQDAGQGLQNQTSQSSGSDVAGPGDNPPANDDTKSPASAATNTASSKPNGDSLIVKISTGTVKLVDKLRMSVNDALDAAQQFLGEGYQDNGNGRFTSADGTRQVRMGDGDILPGKGEPHINFESLKPNPMLPGRYLYDYNLHI